MILVTLGTHPQPMDRLVEALDELLAKGELEDEIIIQSAAYGRWPRLAQPHGIQPFEVLAEWARSARAIVTHGGPGSIALALSMGHSPVVVPRDPAFGEHVDDHQLRFAAWLAERRDITVVRDMHELSEALRKTLVRREQRVLRPHVPAKAIACLRAIVNGTP